MTRRDPRRFPFPPAIPAAALVISWGMGRVWPIRLAWPAWTTPIGWVLFLVPHLLAWWAIGTFRRRRTAIDPRGDTTAVVRSGPYAFTRNPMYVTLIVVYIGGMLAFHLPWAAVFLVPVFLTLHFGVIRPEEEYLAHTFGEDYRRYMRDVRRWI